MLKNYIFIILIKGQHSCGNMVPVTSVDKPIKNAETRDS